MLLKNLIKEISIYMETTRACLRFNNNNSKY